MLCIMIQYEIDILLFALYWKRHDENGINGSIFV
jgi:hypothetical protein